MLSLLRTNFSFLKLWISDKSQGMLSQCMCCLFANLRNFYCVISFLLFSFGVNLLYE